MGAVDGAAQGLRPEARRLVYVIDVAVNQHGAKAGVVHADFPRSPSNVDDLCARGLTLSAAGSIASAMKSQTENARRN
jgi:hypothetical protein